MSMNAPDLRPPINSDVAFFYEGLAEHRLRIQKCDSCGLIRNPPTPRCPACRSEDWRAVDGALTGTLHSYTIHHFPPIPPFVCPHTVGLADMDDGYRLIGSLTTDDADAIRIGMRVRARFRTIGDFPTFEFHPDVG